jgi:hypothetical protein
MANRIEKKKQLPPDDHKDVFWSQIMVMTRPHTYKKEGK